MIQTRDNGCLDHTDHSAYGKKWVDLRFTGREIQEYLPRAGMWDATENRKMRLLT